MVVDADSQLIVTTSFSLLTIILADAGHRNLRDLQQLECQDFDGQETYVQRKWPDHSYPRLSPIWPARLAPGPGRVRSVVSGSECQDETKFRWGHVDLYPSAGLFEQLEFELSWVS